MKSRLAPLLDVFGFAFVLAWGCAVVAFPVVKGLLAGYVPVVVGMGAGVLLLRFRSRLASTLDGPPPHLFLGGALAVAVVVRAIAIVYFPLEPMVDDAQFQRYAVSMAAGGGYGAPGVLAWFPPGMSFVLAALYSVTTPSPLVGKVLQLVIGGLLVWQTWATTRFFATERTARWAALLVAVFPTLVFYTATLGYEILLALLLLVLCRLTSWIAQVSGRAIGGLVALGALVGFGAFIKPICLLLPVVIGCAWWMLGNRSPRVALRVAVIVGIMAAVISPWTMRNYRVLGAFVPISTNGGTTLYAANNPHANGLAMQVEPLPGEVDEVSRDRVRLRGALAWIVGHPLRWFELALIKVTYTWGTSSSIMSVVSTDRLPPAAESICKAILNVGWAGLFVLCAAATVKDRPWSKPGFVPATLVVAYIFGLHLFYEAHSRHHVSVLPLLCIVGAWSLGAASETPSTR